MNIRYQIGGTIDIDEIIAVYSHNKLSVRRPIHNKQLMQDMINHTDILVTAWHEMKLVGVSRTVTDFNYVAYIADIVVDEDYQNQGIGKQLIQHTRDELKPTCYLTLFSAEWADDYYKKLGWERKSLGWKYPPKVNPLL